MTNWKTYRLGDLVEINKKSINKDYSFEEIEYLDTSSVTDNIFSELQRIKVTEAPSRAKRIVMNDDIVYSTVRPIQRHYGLIKNANPNTVASTGFAVISPIKIDAAFLFYYLTQDEIVYYLNGIAESNTSTFPAFNASLFETLEVTIPETLVEQKRIASILTSLDDKIELNLQMNQTLKAMAQAIFKEWFINFNFPGCDGELVDGLPKGWRNGLLDEIISFKNGKSSPERDDNLTFPVFGSNGIIGYADKFNADENSTIIGRVGSYCGSTYFSTKKCWVTDNAIIAQSKYGYASFSYLKLLSLNLNNYRAGSGQPLINQSILGAIPLVIPSENVMGEFEKIVLPLFEKAELNNDNIIALTNTRDRLLHKLMSGKIEIKA